MSETAIVAGVQMDVIFGESAKNLDRILQGIQEAAAQAAELVVFPECALTGYCFESLAEALPVAEPVPGPSIDRITQACAEHKCFVVVGMLELDGERVFNACVLVGPEGPVGTYRKVHMPGLGIDWHATPGDQPYQVWKAGSLTIGMNICYDGGFPEASRVMALQGADLIVLPTNWPPAAMPFAEHAINTRAMENNVYYMSVDRVGTERGFPFIGMSRVCSPSGETMASADHNQETIIYAEIDPEKARRKKLVRVPGKHEIDRLKDRRPEMYGPLVEPAATGEEK